MEMETAHFFSHFRQEDGELAQRLVSLAERDYRRIQEDFGFSEGEKGNIKLFLCGDVDEFLERTGKDRESYQKWMVGYSDAQARQICLLSPATAGISETELCRILTHELVHIIFDSATDYPKISDLSGCGDVGAQRFAAQGGYDYAGIYVWYFLQRFGFERFLHAYRGECSAGEWLYDGFEREAIVACRMQGGSWGSA